MHYIPQEELCQNCRLDKIGEKKKQEKGKNSRTMLMNNNIVFSQSLSSAVDVYASNLENSLIE